MILTNSFLFFTLVCLAYNGYKDLKTLKVDLRFPFIRLGYALAFYGVNVSLGYLSFFDTVLSFFVSGLLYFSLKRSKSMTDIDVMIIVISVFSLSLVSFSMTWLFLFCIFVTFTLTYLIKKRVKKYKKRALPLAWFVFCAYLIVSVVGFVLGLVVDNTYFIFKVISALA